MIKGGVARTGCKKKRKIKENKSRDNSGS